MRRLRVVLLALLLTLGATAPARANPAALLLTLLSSIGGVTGLTTGGIVIGGTLVGGSLTLAGSILAGVVGIGLAVGANLLVNSLFKTKGPKPRDVQGVVRQSLPPRWRHYGRRRVGGALLFIETYNGDLDMVIGLGQGVMDGVEEITADDRVLTIDGAGNVTGPTEINGRMIVKTQAGTASDTAFSELTSRYPTIYDSNHKALGIAKVFARQKATGANEFQAAWPNRIATINVVGRFTPVYDPREAGQDQTDPATYVFSQNLALQLADYFANADGMQIPWSYINAPILGDAADICDEVLTTKSGGSVARYHGGLSYSLPETEPDDVIKRFIQAMDGRLTLLPNGTLAIDAGEWVEPTVHLTDDVIQAFDLKDSAGPLREANVVTVNYTFEEARWSETTCDPWRDEDDITLSGEERTREVDAFEITNHNHARRIAKLTAARTGPRWQGTIVTDLSGMLAWPTEEDRHRFIRLTIADLGIEAESFEVLDIGVDLSSVQVVMQVASMTAAAYAFDAATEEGTAPEAPAAVESDPIAEPDVTVTTSTIAVNGGVTTGVMNVSWLSPGRSDLRAEVEYSEAGANIWQPVGVSGGALSTQIVGLADGTDYDVRVRFVTNSGTPTAWTVVEDIPIVADPVAPGVPTALSVAAGGAPSTAEVFWTAPDSGNYRFGEIYRNTVNDAPSATKIGTREGAANGAYSFETVTLSAGTHYFWVAACNGSGVASARTYAGSISI